MVQNEDLEGDHHKLLLTKCTQSLLEILPLSSKLSDWHFEVAVVEADREQLDITKQGAAFVIATINGINTFTESQGAIFYFKLNFI